ncbi:MAG: assimilatory sulfite reductase (NADPH) flavoprotein subunit [Opitutales bacterium]
MQLPVQHPLTPQQAKTLSQLDLTRDQALWLSGFLAGFGATPADAPAGAASAAAPTAATEVVILYGSESGNSEGLAERTRASAKQKGLNPKVVNMADASPAQLKQWQNLLVIVSTWGDGDPPDSAAPFYEALLNGSAPKLSGNRFAVLALGDTSYEHFCLTGRKVDERLGELGAERIAPRVDCDVDYEDPYEKWAADVLRKLSEATSEAATTSTSTAEAPAAITAPAVEYGKKNPFPAPLKERVLLNGRGSAKETYHLEIGLEGSGLTYEPGDALALLPSNSPHDVDLVIGATGLAPETPVDDGFGSEVPLYEALLHRYDITNASSLFLRKYQGLADNAELEKVISPEHKEQLKDYLWGRQIVDIVETFKPKHALDPKDFLGILRKMPPRLYSISSSLKAHPDEVHLTIAAVRYTSHGRKRTGVASTFIADRVEIGGTMPVYLHHNKNFRLPADPATPVVMVGPGTGVAPFRAFLEERQATGASGKNWLFFGDQHFLTDFLYQTEFQDYLKSGNLDRLDLAFSRDQKRKVYVQNRMTEAGRELYDWLENGAYFYVCGDASRMAGDVHEALIQIVSEHGGRPREEAEAYVNDLRKVKRYQRDVY